MKCWNHIFLVPICAVIAGCAAREGGSVYFPKEYIEETAETVNEVSSEFSGHKDGLSETDLQANASKEYVFSQSSERKLNREDVYGISADAIRIGRNEIYARHGRKFADLELQEWFDSKDWYEGNTEPDKFDESMLSETEKHNVMFLKDMEDVIRGSKQYLEILKEYEGQVIWICVDEDSSYDVHDNYVVLHGGSILAAMDCSDKIDTDMVSAGDLLELGGGIYLVKEVDEKHILIDFQKRSDNTDNPDVGSIEADNRINIIPELYWYIDRWETGYNYYVETLQIGDWIDYKGPDGSGYNWYMLGDSECIAKETLYEGDIYFSTECYTHALKRPNLTLYNETGITEYFDSVIETEFKHPIPSLGFYKMDELGEVIKYVEMYTP